MSNFQPDIAKVVSVATEVEATPSIHIQLQAEYGISMTCGNYFKPK